MTAAMRLSLRAGGKLYINGAVLRVDRKTSIEILNDATFLLDHHVMQPEDASSPLRQLYFIAQTMLIDPDSAPGSRFVFDESRRLLTEGFEHPRILAGLESIGELMETGRTLEVMKTIRALIPIEDEILAGNPKKPKVA